MLTLLLGRARSGKTSYIYNELKRKADRGVTGLLLLVPEQYSHEAESQLCKVCGDSISLFGEVLSFSRLCNRVFTELGGISRKTLDSGGRILLMNRALQSVSSHLRVYGVPSRRTEFLESLLATMDEFKTSCINPAQLFDAAHMLNGPLSDKLYDLSLILGAYDSFITGDMADPGNRLTHLAEQIGSSKIITESHIYIDGFTDFTKQEMRILEQLIKKNADLTICLTCDSLEDNEEIFALSRETVMKLKKNADEYGVAVNVLRMKEKNAFAADELIFLEQNLFSFAEEKYEHECSAISLVRTDDPVSECEFAASKVLALIRKGYRYRDIAIVARGWENYDALIENIFEKYGVPIFQSRKSDILQKPPIAMIAAALDVITNGWEYESVFRYLKTGLTGIRRQDCDLLENYVLKWNIRGSMWTSDAKWTRNPSGYVKEMSESDRESLGLINTLRLKITVPLIRLDHHLKEAVTMGDQIHALYEYLECIALPQRLEERVESFKQKGDLQLKNEYEQLWQIIIEGMEQFAMILGTMNADRTEFVKLWNLVISQYDVGVIPVSLDRVAVGDMLRLRKRNIKCLIVIGATDEAIPGEIGRSGILSAGERDELIEYGIHISDNSENTMYREMNVIYSSLTMPNELLIVSYPRTGADGGEKRPAFIIQRIKEIYNVSEHTEDSVTCSLAAMMPCFEVAVMAERLPANRQALAAREYFLNIPGYASRLEKAKVAANQSRGQLSAERSQTLYGKTLSFSASRIDKYYSCRFSYFLQYGLRAKPRKPAGFEAPEAGTFMHYILENVARDIDLDGGFNAVSNDKCRNLTEYYVNRYIEEVLKGFADRSSRFRYLFNRLVKDVHNVVIDMVRELKVSKYHPVDFELEFSSTGDLPPAQLEGNEVQVNVNGFVDRVDGWVHNGRLYLRIVDYKTGKKSFSLSDICYGIGMQMLIYLFALQKNGTKRYGQEIVPAGVLYAPAREVILPAPRNSSNEEIEILRAKYLKRSGLILDESDNIAAMEVGNDFRYLPVKIKKDGAISGESLVSLEQLGKLSAHIDRTLIEVGKEIQRGVISADPYFRNAQDHACLYCDFRQACHFDPEGGNDKNHFLTKLNAAEAWQKIERDCQHE